MLSDSMANLNPHNVVSSCSARMVTSDNFSLMAAMAISLLSFISSKLFEILI